jgi:hypothetical protein
VRTESIRARREAHGGHRTTGMSVPRGVALTEPTPR